VRFLALRSGEFLVTSEYPEIDAELKKAQASAELLRGLSPDKKLHFLKSLAEYLKHNQDQILKANEMDLQNLPAETPPAFRDRLTLNTKRLAQMAESLIQVAQLEDPVGETVESRVLQNGLLVKKVRAPLGIVLMIFESRPNVITEAFSLAFKSGNFIILRGGSESKQTASAIYKIIFDLAGKLQLGFDPCWPLQNYDRKIVSYLLTRKNEIDIVVPRGGDALIEFVVQNSKIPIIKNDRGLCHAYVSESANLKMAVAIIENGKMQRPGVCNSLETVLVHQKVAKEFIPLLFTACPGLQWRVDQESFKLLPNSSKAQLASPQDWDTEYLDLIINCKIVQSDEEAFQHIARHGSKHSETIITENETLARSFQNRIDAAAVYWNASTRFTDGFELGLGGELGISTQKLHVRGPVGLREMTSVRWIIDGKGQTRA